MSELARFIQEDQKEYTDISRPALVSVLTGFRSSLPPGELIKKRLPQTFIAAKKEVEEAVDEVKEMEALYRLQMQRIAIDSELEKNLGKLMPSMTSEIKEARQILESVSNMKMEMGLNDRAPTKHEFNVEVDEVLESDLSQHFGSSKVKKVLENPESRHKVMGTVEKFLRFSSLADAAQGRRDEDDVS